LEAAVNLRSLGAAQRVACDVSGDGYVDVNDAVLILEYVVALIPRFPVAQTCNSDWAFIPEAAAVPNQHITNPQIATTSCQPNGAIQYLPLVGQADNQNFSGVLFGDCLGRWQPGAGAATAMNVAPPRTASVRVGPYGHRSRHRLLVPLTITDGLRGFSAQVHYDATRLTAVGVRPAGRNSSTLVQTNLRTPGMVNIAAASTQAMPGGQALVIEFAVKNERGGFTSIRLRSTAVVR